MPILFFFQICLPMKCLNLMVCFYTLKLMFGNVDENGFSEIDQFFVFEGNSASAQLLGTITADFPTPVPVPAALPLFLSTITGLALVGRRKSNRTQ